MKEKTRFLSNRPRDDEEDIDSFDVSFDVAGEEDDDTPWKVRNDITVEDEDDEDAGIEGGATLKRNNGRTSTIGNPVGIVPRGSGPKKSASGRKKTGGSTASVRSAGAMKASKRSAGRGKAKSKTSRRSRAR